MAPIRRYLRITKYSVLECRIYVDNPALAHSWLLNPRNPVLPRVIDAVRPLVLPKLREENERAKKKSTKKKGIKDEVVEDDFEVSIFLTGTGTRHSLLCKHKHFRDKTQTKLRSNSSKLIGASRDAAIDVDEDAARPAVDLEEGEEEEEEEEGEETTLSGPRREGSSDEDAPVALDDIPAIDDARPAKRRRSSPRPQDGGEVADSDDAEEASDDESLFVASDRDPVEDEGGSQPPAKRLKGAAADGEPDDKKKLAMGISYEGFAIYGRVLCLVVKRRDGSGRAAGASSSAQGARGKSGAGPAAGQAMMENWITSTQMPEGAAAEEADAF